MTESETIQQIATDLLRAGVRRGGVLLVHSSLRSLGPVPGGAETVVRGFLEALGPDGTLLMPALSYQHVTPPELLFDVRATPSNVGNLPEYFRTRPGTRRSLHPTHSVSGVGRQAAALLADHGLDRTPVGPHSPFHLLPLAGGQLVMLGCGLRPNTSMHGVEELVEPPYLYGTTLTYRLVDEDGRRYEANYRRHGFAGWRQRYDRIAGVLSEPDLRSGPVLASQTWVIEASGLWRAGEACLHRDPHFFVEPTNA